jgi:hypothetical protein
MVKHQVVLPASRVSLPLFILHSIPFMHSLVEVL